MRKPASLRKHLEHCLPQLKKHPDRLVLRIEGGRVASKRGRSLSFEWKYKLVVLFTDYCDPPSALVVVMLAWISEHQPDLLFTAERCEQALSFESEPVNHEAIDIAFTLDLSERVIVKPTAGSWMFEHVPEPQMPNDDEGVRGWQVFLKGELILESAEPPLS